MSEQKKAEPMTEAQTAEAEQKLTDIPSVSSHEFRKYLLWTWAECYGLRLLATIRALQEDLRTRERAEAEALAVVMSHEAHIEQQDAQIEALKQANVSLQAENERLKTEDKEYAEESEEFANTICALRAQLRAAQDKLSLEKESNRNNVSIAGEHVKDLEAQIRIKDEALRLAYVLKDEATKELWDLRMCGILAPKLEAAINSWNASEYHVGRLKAALAGDTEKPE